MRTEHPSKYMLLAGILIIAIGGCGNSGLGEPGTGGTTGPQGGAGGTTSGGSTGGVTGSGGITGAGGVASGGTTSTGVRRVRVEDRARVAEARAVPPARRHSPPAARPSAAVCWVRAVAILAGWWARPEERWPGEEREAVVEPSTLGPVVARLARVEALVPLEAPALEPARRPKTRARLYQVVGRTK